jgi:multidrug resistance efflux pump
MRSSEFKKQASELRIIKESSKKPKKINWDRLIYLGILCTILAVLGWFLFWKFLMIDAIGNVQFETFNVRFVNDTQILDYKIEEGKAIHKGDTLFTYIQDKSLEHDKNIGQKYLEDSIAYEKEMQLLKQEIKFKKAEININDNIIGMLQHDFDKMKEEVYLDVYTIDKLNPISKQLNEAKEKKNLLLQQVGILEQDLEKILTMKAFSHQSSTHVHQKDVHAYISPIDGTISHIFKKAHEIALENEQIISVNLPADNIIVKAYFDQKDLHKLKINDVVNVKFANGKISKGRIQRFYFDSYELPIHLMNSNKETFMVNIETDIVPFNEADKDIWKQNQKLSVDVFKSKYF